MASKKRAPAKTSRSAKTSTPSTTSPPSKASPPSGDTQAVTEFMRTLDHPLKAEIEALRRIVLESDPRIREGIKWNAPSFRVTDYFATFHLRSRDAVQVILHRGAKVKDNSTAGVPIQDPAGLLQWLALERATVRFADMADIVAKRRAFREIISQWVETM